MIGARAFTERVLSRFTARSRYADALRTIGTDCQTFTRGRCSDRGSGRRRGARYGADKWCDGCISHEALR